MGKISGMLGLLCVTLLARPAYAERPTEVTPNDEHPLLPLVRMATARLKTFDEEVRDYTCMLVKRERVDGKVLEYEHIELKLRHERVADDGVVPFSVYLKFLGPAELRGREVVYVEGRNKGQLIALKGGPRLAYLTTAVDPESGLAMERARYPITEVGIKTLIERLLEVAHEELEYDDCQVRYFAGTKVDGRNCTLVEVTHPKRRRNVRYHLARIFIDEELNLPTRYAAYDWPEEEGGRPRLLEEYTYLNLKFNSGLTDADFDHRNPAYGFDRTFEP